MLGHDDHDAVVEAGSRALRICEASLDEVLGFFLGSEKADADSAGAGAFPHTDHQLFHQAPRCCGQRS